MKFMVCYDDSPLSKDVIREAQEHAAQWNATLEVVMTVTRIVPIKHTKLKEMEDRLKEKIQLFFEGVDIPYTVSLQVDDMDAGEKIVEIAQRNNADLIFIGIKKHSKVGKLLFGSTAQYIILNAPCSVVTVNPS